MPTRALALRDTGDRAGRRRDTGHVGTCVRDRAAADPTDPVDTLIVAGGRGVMRAAEDASLIDGSGPRRSGEADGLGLHRRVYAGRRRPPRRSPRGHALGILRAAGSGLSGRDVEPDPIFVNDGPVWTSAGVTAGIDLALALVEEDLGRTVALAVARHLVVFLKRPGGQAQFSAALSLQWRRPFR